MPKTDVEQEIERLRVLPPGEFIAGRNAVAARLRAAGHADAARAIKALRKPTRVEWLIARLRRDRPEEMARLGAARKDLERAQSLAMTGGASAGDELRAAMAEVRDSLAPLVEDVPALAKEAGWSSPAAALALDVEAALRASTAALVLATPLHAVTHDKRSAAKPRANAGAKPGAKPSAKAAQEAKRIARSAARDAKASATRRLKSLAREAHALASSAATLRAAADHARRAAEAAARDAEAKSKLARAAEERARAASERAVAAEEAHRRALLIQKGAGTEVSPYA